MVGRAKVIVAQLNFRPSPSGNNTPLRTLPAGTEVEVLAEVDGWYKVLDQGQEGYISASPSYVQFTATDHTREADLVVLTLPASYEPPSTVRLHPRAAAAFLAALSAPGLTLDDIRALCRVNSSFRSWDSQMDLIRRYEAAIGAKWTSWSKLNAGQLAAARAAGFAFHPGNPPVDRPHTHVGGGALDIHAPLPPRARAALEANGWKLDSPGDAVHWGWHG